MPSTRSGDRGPMLVVDAGCIVDLVSIGPKAPAVEGRLALQPHVAVPHLIDVEVLAVIRRHHLNGRLDRTAATLAVDWLREWPAERLPHGPLLARAWELRNNVSAPDAIYVALAESLGATLLTIDRRLANTPGPTCPIEVL